MKTLIFIGIALLMPLLPITAQYTADNFHTPNTHSPDRTIAYFPGLKSYVNANLKYPAAALESRIEGRVEATALILADGSVGEVKIVRGISWSCDQAVLNLIRNMPARWKPATRQGRLVAQTVDLAITFRLKT